MIAIVEKRKHNKRHTPNNLVSDIIIVYYDFKQRLKSVNLAVEDNEFLTKFVSLQDVYFNLYNYRKLESYNLYEIEQLSDALYAAISPIIYEYGFGMLRQDIDDDFSDEFDVDSTFYETTAYLTHIFKINDKNIIELNILNGNVQKIFKRFEYFMMNRQELSNDLFFNVYQRAFNRIKNSYKIEGELDFEFNLIQKKLRKERSRKAIMYSESMYKCPNCEEVLYDSKQNYCHKCAQRLSNIETK